MIGPVLKRLKINLWYLHFNLGILMSFLSENYKEPLFWFVANRKFSKIEGKEKYEELSEEDKEVVGQLGFWIWIINWVL